MFPALLQAIVAVCAPAPIREIRGASAYAKNPSKAVTPVAIIGRALPRNARALLDIYMMTKNR